MVKNDFLNLNPCNGKLKSEMNQIYKFNNKYKTKSTMIYTVITVTVVVVIVITVLITDSNVVFLTIICYYVTIIRICPDRQDSNFKFHF